MVQMYLPGVVPSTGAGVVGTGAGVVTCGVVAWLSRAPLVIRRRTVNMLPVFVREMLRNDFSNKTLLIEMGWWAWGKTCGTSTDKSEALQSEA